MVTMRLRRALAVPVIIAHLYAPTILAVSLVLGLAETPGGTLGLALGAVAGLTVIVAAYCVPLRGRTAMDGLTARAERMRVWGGWPTTSVDEEGHHDG
ncbi:hypothetical protein [Streptomyces sp. SPB78]|uniref:hypothetical protein n=1 Tax=Streptomyces sp. (strain SPB78) TaxID=591157 RepID=UPI0001B54F62|nr:hypothetical protein [Streptomyces sp. SPB78]